VRAHAIARIRGTAPIPDLYQLYQNTDSRAVRLSIVHGLIARKEPEATDRLIDVAKTSTDVEVRATAIRALGRSPRKEDPKVARALSEILACCEP
jgi:HEAT repeat protein